MNQWRQVKFGTAFVFLLAGNSANAQVPSAPAFVTLLADQKYQDAYGEFDDQVKAGLPAAKLEAVWHDLLAQLGAFKSTGEIKTTKTNGYTVVFVQSVFEKGTIWTQVAYDNDGKIGGLHFLPATK